MFQLSWWQEETDVLVQVFRQEEIPLTHWRVSLCVWFRLSTDWMKPTQRGQFPSLSLQIQMFVLSKNTLTDPPRIIGMLWPSQVDTWSHPSLQSLSGLQGTFIIFRPLAPIGIISSNSRNTWECPLHAKAHLSICSYHVCWHLINWNKPHGKLNINGPWKYIHLW